MSIKILVIGDFHGKVSQKLKKKISKLDYDIILSPGDFAGGNFGKELLEYEIKLYNKYGDIRKLPKDVKEEAKKKYRSWYIRALNNSKKVIFWLKSLKKPVYYIHGNWDLLKKERKKFVKEKIGLNELKGNLHFIHLKRVNLNNILLMGFGGYRVTSLKEYFRYTTKGKKIPLKEINKFKNKWIKSIKKLFEHKIPNKKFVIFVVHDPPYKTKLDYLKNKRMHIGEKIFNDAIKRYKPNLVICGHMHENQGISKIGKTKIINSGAAYEGKAVIIEIDKEKIKKIKFIKR